jgi:excisionase family DNA binding protein
VLETVSPEPALSPLLDVHDAAKLLGVSDSWVYRHQKELPAVAVGRLIRFNPLLLANRFSSKSESNGSGKSLWKEQNTVIAPKRYQQGGVYRRGKTWYGTFREDVSNTEGVLSRKGRNIRLGTLSDIPTKAAARNELQKRMILQDKPTVEMSFSQLFERWQETIVPTLKHSTANVYTHALKSRILPILGTVPINKLGRYEVEKFLAGKGQSYSRNTLKDLRSSLSRVMQWAVDCKWIGVNPCRGVKLPNGTGNTITRNVLTPEQVRAIVEKLPEPYSTLILFLALTGLRIGEAVGVRWADFDGEVLNVSRRVYEGTVGTLKTKKSKRSIPIPASLMQRLNKLNHVSEWVFSSENGTPVNPGNALRRYIQPLARELGIKLSGFHDLRHTLATDLINSGVSAKTVSEILGHANVGITLNTYTHPALENFKGPLNERAANFVI